MECRLQTSFADNAGHCRKSVVKTENIKNEPDRLVFLGDGAQKATAVEHINQNSFLLIIFARTVIAFSYDISSYNKTDVFSL